MLSVAFGINAILDAFKTTSKKFNKKEELKTIG